jgi:hypothetical protein
MRQVRLRDLEDSRPAICENRKSVLAAHLRRTGIVARDTDQRAPEAVVIPNVRRVVPRGLTTVHVPASMASERIARHERIR